MIADLEALVADLETMTEPVARERARGVVAGVLELHRAALARILDAAGAATAARLADDEVVAPILVLHGLHPMSLPERVTAAAARLRAAGVEVDVLEATADGVRVRLSRGDRMAVERALLAAVPDAAAIVVLGEPPAATPVRWVGGAR
jgi:hypothetical protein